MGGYGNFGAKVTCDEFTVSPKSELVTCDEFTFSRKKQEFDPRYIVVYRNQTYILV